MTYGKRPFHGMEIGKGNWTGIRNCFPMHLISQVTACLSGITDWAEQSLTKHSIPALGEQEIWGEVRNVHCQKEKPYFIVMEARSETVC